MSCLVRDAEAGVNKWTTTGPIDARIDTLAVDPSAPATVYAGGDPSRGVFKTTNGGGSWTTNNVGLTDYNVASLAVDPSAPATVYAGTASGVFRSINGAASWTTINNGLIGKNVAALVIDPSAPAILYAGLTGTISPGPATPGGVFKSTNRGDSWTKTLTEFIVALAIDPSAPATLYAGTFLTGVYKSSDGGGTWTGINTGLTSTRISALAVDPSSSTTLYAGTVDRGVFKTTDGGGHWVVINAGLPTSFISAVVIDPSAQTTLYAGTYEGVFKSINGGGSWTGVNTGLTLAQVPALVIDPSATTTLYAGSFGGGVFDYETVSTAAACVSGTTTLCVNGDRFRVQVSWRVPSQGTSGVGMATAITGDTGHFWFFSENNIEVTVKVVDGRAFNDYFWVFAGALSDVEYTVTVTDTVTGVVKTYFNPGGRLASVADTAAFRPSVKQASVQAIADVEGADSGGAGTAVPPVPVEPLKTADACAAGPTTLCLHGGHFQVQVNWRAPSQGTAGFGRAVPLTTDTGYLWFFSDNNVELVIKVLDGRAFNGRFWVFFGALSNVEYTITVTDTSSGQTRTYFNPSGQLASVADTAAF